MLDSFKSIEVLAIGASIVIPIGGFIIAETIRYIWENGFLAFVFKIMWFIINIVAFSVGGCLALLLHSYLLKHGYLPKSPNMVFLYLYGMVLAGMFLPVAGLQSLKEKVIGVNVYDY